MKRKLRNQIGMIFFVIGGLFVGMMIYTFSVIEQNSEDGVVINLAGRERMLTQKMTKEAMGIYNGVINPGELRETAKLFDKTLKGLIYGNDELPAVKNEKVLKQLNIVKNIWEPFYLKVKLLQNEPKNREALEYLIANNIKLLQEMDKAVKLFETDTRVKLDYIKFLSVVIGLLTIVTTTIILIASKNKLVAPIDKLVAATKQIAGGDLDVHLNFNYKNEFDDLGKSFEELAKSIKEYRQDLINEKESIKGKVDEAVAQAEKEKAYLTASIDRIVEIMEQVATGDLSIFVEVREDDSANIKRLFCKVSQGC